MASRVGTAPRKGSNNSLALSPSPCENPKFLSILSCITPTFCNLRLLIISPSNLIIHLDDFISVCSTQFLDQLKNKILLELSIYLCCFHQLNTFESLRLVQKVSKPQLGFAVMQDTIFPMMNAGP